MLVLSRKINESIMIGSQVEVVVLGVEGDTVKVGIRAPRNIDIYRKELYAAIKTTNQEAAVGSDEYKKLIDLIRAEQHGE